MNKKSKKGGAFEYAKMFDQPLSPCYQQNGKSIFKAGWHSGGSKMTCNSQPSVSEMGIKNTPLNNQPSPSLVAWDSRYSCGKMAGGSTLNNFLEKETIGNKKVFNKLKEIINENAKSKTLILKGSKNNDKFTLTVFYQKNNEKPFKLTIQKNNETDVNSNDYKNINTLKNRLNTFVLEEKINHQKKSKSKSKK